MLDSDTLISFRLVTTLFINYEAGIVKESLSASKAIQTYDNTPSIMTQSCLIALKRLFVVQTITPFFLKIRIFLSMSIYFGNGVKPEKFESYPTGFGLVESML